MANLFAEIKKFNAVLADAKASEAEKAKALKAKEEAQQVIRNSARCMAQAIFRKS